jgi:NhaC family Na+:H+ antiporter
MSSGPKPVTPPREPSLLDALIPLGFLAVSILASVLLFGDATGGPLQVALIFSASVAVLVARKNGYSVEAIGKAINDGVGLTVNSIFILLAVGAMIGTWNMSGTIATLIYYGIQILSPTWFYFTAALICAVVGLATGSSWTTVGTLGIGLTAVGVALGMNPAITAGAVISGAYFGDKMTPLSETTILTPQLVGTDVYTHIRAMLWTALPALLIALGLYAFIGLNAGEVVAPIDKSAALAVLDATYRISVVNLLPLVVLLILAVRRAPAFAAILTGALIGGVMAVLVQPQVVLTFVNDAGLVPPLVMLKGVWTAMATGYQAATGLPALDDLLSGGGMSSMLFTVWLILGAIAFGSVMQMAGLTDRLIAPLIEHAKSTGRLIASVIVTAIGFNVFCGDQYIAIIMPATVFRLEFRKRGLAPETLSRAVEDSGTVTSALVPWNSCGAYIAAALGVPTASYLPYCFFNLINPIVSLIYGFTGFTIKRIPPDGEEVAAADAATLERAKVAAEISR